MIEYHTPVLLKESIDALNIKDGGIYVDATLGGGGHTEAILKTGKKIRLFSFDKDEDSIKHAEKLLGDNYENILLIKDNFKNLRTRLSLEMIKKIDGILFDLGVSSHQIGTSDRGFSFSLDGELDMRMDQDSDLTAYQIINNFSFKELRSIFYEYGEEKEAARIAGAIVEKRDQKKIKTTLELSEIIEKSTISKHKLKAKARIFQSIRIYLNDEINNLKTALKDAVNILNPHGRIAVISYHSLEDRVVKQFFRYEEKSCICPSNFPKCICDKISTLKILTRKPVLPSSEEIQNNKRARSAKLRVAERKSGFTAYAGYAAIKKEK